MYETISASIRFSLLSWILCGIVYPLASTIAAQAIFPFHANGSLLTSRDGSVIGSRLIGQNWTAPRWFHGRPSATTGIDPSDPNKSIAAPYNASNSGGSNLGPTSEELWQRLSTDRKTLELLQPRLAGRGLPADMLTTSASGLDPDISIANALLQAPRVAAARGLSEDTVRALIERHRIGTDLGIFAEPRANVLELNLSLERDWQ
ncbi:MAG: potassium-transporting ATPase subunit KdpC [Deltaproteobacteria bacterium]|nr:potassium-transporting ATPase subunit KdpC [Deltaproteobacteria bacterium]